MQNYAGQQLNENALVQYGDNANGLSIGDYCIPYPNYYPIYEQHYHTWYPSFPAVAEKSKVEQGFKIVAKMLENKIIVKELTVKDFIKLVNDIAEII